jgi:hypothetical protein
MELLETDDPVKGQLLKKSARHREQLEDDARMISERTEKIITNAIIIGGALAVTYFLVSRFSGSKQKKKGKAARIKLVQEGRSEEVASAIATEPEPPGMVSQITTALASQATVFLLGLAKEKLGEFLQSQQAEKKPRSNEPS